MSATGGWLVPLLQRVARFGVLLGSLAAAGGAAIAAEPVTGDASRRQRIAHERAAAEAAWQAERLRCAERFAVTPCINSAAAVYRQQIDALDRELDRLDTEQRRVRAAERFEIIQRKTEALEASAEPTAASPAPAATAESEAAVLPGPVSRGVDAEIAKRRAEAARQAAQRAEASRRRQAEATRRRAERAEQRERRGESAAPLPLPSLQPAQPAASRPAR